jgi:hypothetical protein
MMVSSGRRHRQSRLRGLALAVGIGLGVGIAVTPAAVRAARRRPWHSPPRVVTIRQVIVRREPLVIQAATLAQLRQELRRARLGEAGYERQIAQQYQTIRRLQAQLDLHLRELREANAQRAAQLDGQYNVILQAFGLVIFAIIGALLVALSRSHARFVEGSDALPTSPPAVDWGPLQRQLREAKSALATVETRLRRLETSIDPFIPNH